MFNAMWQNTMGVKSTNIALSICPVPGAIQWYQLYAGTPLVCLLDTV